MAEKTQHDEATEHPDEKESRIIAELIEKHCQAMKAKALKYRAQSCRGRLRVRYQITAAKVAEKVMASRRRRRIKAMKRTDKVDRGDYYEVVIKGPFIDSEGRVAEFAVREDYILFSGITVKYPKKPVAFCISNLQTVKDIQSDIMTQVFRTIREAPKEIHAAYRKAYYKAIEEYDERVKNKPPPLDQDDGFEKIRDQLLSAAQIKADRIIRADLIRKGKINIWRNQTGQVDPQNVNVDLAAMLNVKGTLEESNIEKQISNRQALAEQKAKQCIGFGMLCELHRERRPEKNIGTLLKRESSMKLCSVSRRTFERE